MRGIGEYCIEFWAEFMIVTKKRKGGCAEQVRTNVVFQRAFNDHSKQTETFDHQKLYQVVFYVQDT